MIEFYYKRLTKTQSTDLSSTLNSQVERAILAVSYKDHYSERALLRFTDLNVVFKGIASAALPLTSLWEGVCKGSGC